MKTIQLLESSSFDGKTGKAVYLLNGKREERELVKVKEEELPFKFEVLNPLQTAFYLNYEGGNALISSPTSSGKSLIALLFYLRNKVGKFIYTAPTRSLIWEKFKEFKSFFKRVGVRTGDLIEELSEIDQPAVVCTYESLISSARNRARWFEEAGALVIDEVHVIRDEGRGAVIEELVSYALNEEIPILALSATIPGAGELAKWLGAELFIDSRWRPVPLERKVYNFKRLLREKKLPADTPEEKVVSVVESFNLKGKTLVFVPRKDLGWQALYVENLKFGKEVLNQTLPFEPNELKGEKVAFHNADVPQEEREEIEREFREGELSRLYATQTLAYGVNLPADNVVIFVRGWYDRFSMEYRFFPDPLTILQMEGRAGRFGLSEKGRSYIVITGARESSLKEALNEEMEKEFKTALSEGVRKEGSSCPNKRKSVLSLMVLGPLVRYGGKWKEVIREFFSIKRNPLLVREVEKVIEELEEMGFTEGNRPTELTKLLVSSFVSPYCYAEFKERLRKSRNLIEKEPTTGYLFTVRPFIKRELWPKTVSLFTGEGFKQEARRIVSEIESETGLKVKDNSEVLIFYAKGGFFPYKNVARPPGELSSLSTESSLLGQLLCRLNAFDFDEVHRIIMSVRSGLKFDFSLLGTIEGLGYMRGNALVRAGELLKAPNEVALINGIKEGITEYYEAVKEALEERHSKSEIVEREFSAIVNAVNKVKFPLGNEKLLKFLSSTFVGRREAIKLSKEEALEVLRENVKGEEEV
ncbi:DEAD/DEAH box helicase [Thermovibrio sp.]